MNIEKAFKTLVLSQILLFIFFISWGIFEADDGTVATISNLELFILLSYLIAYPTILFLLYRFKPLGKKLFLPMIIIYLFLIPFLGPWDPYYTQVDIMSESLSQIIDGMILTFLYFTSIKEKFAR
tara:strand:+ start:614 stop:988 length:375 start_codon:yes stop_codon:yes gene_type:complete